MSLSDLDSDGIDFFDGIDFDDDLDYFDFVDQNYSVKDLEVFLSGHNGFIAGGVFKDIYTMNRFKDVDIYFRNFEDFNKALKLFESKFPKIYSNDNTVAFSGKQGVTVELIKKFFGTPEEVLDSFDFTVTQCALVRGESGFETIEGESFQDDLNNKRLVYVANVADDNTSFRRFSRYIRYGFVPDEKLSMEHLKKFVSEFDELNGVDVDKILKNFSNDVFRVKKVFRGWRGDSFDSQPATKFVLGCALDANKNGDEDGSYSNDFSFDRRVVHFIKNAVDDRGQLRICEESKSLLFNLFSYCEYENNFDVDDKFSVALNEFFHVLWNKRTLVFKEDLIRILNMITCCSFVSLYSGKYRTTVIRDKFVSLEDGHTKYTPNCSNRGLSSSSDMKDLDVILKALSFSDSDEWFQKTLVFFSRLYEEQMEIYPNLREWFKLVDEGNFDPEMNPSILAMLAVD